MIMSPTMKCKIANDLDVKEVGEVEVIEHDVQNLVERIFPKKPRNNQATKEE
jgi:hypothetical protein